MQNLSVRKYRALKRKGLTDPQVLEYMGLSPKSRACLHRWKEANGLIRTPVIEKLNRHEVAELAKEHSYRAIAKMYGIHWKNFHDWLKENRELGYWF